MTATGRDERRDRWADALTAAARGAPGGPVSEVIVYERTASTQDAAWRHRRADAGVAVVASVQTDGRGQRGRRWQDGEAMTLPMSFALPDAPGDVGLAARAGLAALDACRAAAPGADLRIKWPNDVVARVDNGDRKLAGVLIERRDRWAVVGVGVNVFQSAGDLAGVPGACSLAMLGGSTDRLALAAGLLSTLGRWLGADDDAVRAAWAARDAMIGTERAFLVGQERITGVVVGLDPLTAITVRTPEGERVLPVDGARVDASRTA